MIAEPLRLDPQFEHLLREAARDPESSFLRVPRPKIVPALFDSPEPLSANSTGMSLVERELVRVHRNELAWLLKEACRYKLTESPETRAYISKYRTPTEPLRTLSPSELRAKFTERIRRDAEDDECLSALELLERCVAEPFGPWPSVAQMATAAWRLQPRDDARGLAAQWLALGQAPRAALRVLGEIASRSGPATLCATAWTNVGSAFSQLRMPLRAHAAYTEATACEEERLTAWLWRFLFALQVDRVDDAVLCSRSIERLGGAQSPYLDWFVTLVVRGRLRVELSQTASIRGAVRDAWDRLDATGRRIANELR